MSQLVLLEYLKENPKALNKDLTLLIPELRSLMKESCFEMEDGFKFDTHEKAEIFLKHQKEEIVSLLGGEQDVIKNLFNFKGYIKIDYKVIEIVSELTKQLQKDLGLKDYDLFSIENEYLKEISKILVTLVPIGENNFVRAKDVKKAKELYPQYNLDIEELRTSTLIEDLYKKINKLSETNNDVKIVKFETHIDSLLNELENNLDKNIEITKENYEDFKSLYKKFVKNDDFLEDRHMNKLKDLKDIFKEKINEMKFEEKEYERDFD